MAVRQTDREESETARMEEIERESNVIPGSRYILNYRFNYIQDIFSKTPLLSNS